MAARGCAIDETRLRQLLEQLARGETSVAEEPVSMRKRYGPERSHLASTSRRLPPLLVATMVVLPPPNANQPAFYHREFVPVTRTVLAPSVFKRAEA